ncbi:MAG: Arginine--tRNA ligase [Firmicutes bacterium ADurb.Bin080]|nr:MAG: Arginine--tRNA ligase [Firmicutes bacterium ADurb.Bin080]
MPRDKKKEIAEYIQIEGVDFEQIYSSIERPQDLSKGDYALPCFKFSKILRKSPVAIAEMLRDQILKKTDSFESIEAVNGYLNFKFDKKKETQSLLKEVFAKGPSYGDSNEGEGKTVCIDYSSVNIAKPFHIGHLLTTAIGGALYRTYRKLGYNPVGINHLGDWGTQFGKLIVAFKKWGNEKDLQAKGVTYLTELYVKFHKEAEAEPYLDDLAREYFKRIEDGDKEALDLFSLFKDITLREVSKVYARLNIVFDSYAGESFYNDKMAPILKEIEDKKLMKISDGASIVDLSADNMPPCLLVKADGATLYATRDIAAAFYRKRTYDFWKCLYIVAYQQNLHFKQFFKVIEMMGYNWAKDLIHVPFGMVSLESGSLSTRKGNVVLLNDVLNKATEKSLEIIQQKSPNLKDKELVAEKVGVGAVLFFGLSSGRIKDTVFCYDQVLNFDGETGPYVQYTNARCNSIIRKSEIPITEITPEFSAEDLNSLSDDSSFSLISLLSKFGEVLTDSLEKYEPSFITRYIVDVSQAFNKFYLENRIIDGATGTNKPRLALVYATRTVLTEGMRLLGIEAVEEM